MKINVHTKKVIQTVPFDSKLRKLLPINVESFRLWKIYADDGIITIETTINGIDMLLSMEFELKGITKANSKKIVLDILEYNLEEIQTRLLEL